MTLASIKAQVIKFKQEIEPSYLVRKKELDKRQEIGSSLTWDEVRAEQNRLIEEDEEVRTLISSCSHDYSIRFPYGGDKSKMSKEVVRRIMVDLLTFPRVIDGGDVVLKPVQELASELAPSSEFEKYMSEPVRQADIPQVGQQQVTVEWSMFGTPETGGIWENG